MIATHRWNTGRIHFSRSLEIRGCQKVFEKVYEAFYTMTFEYYNGSVHYLVYTYVLVCVRASAFVCVRYRTGEKSYVPEYIYICRFVFSTAQKVHIQI